MRPKFIVAIWEGPLNVSLHPAKFDGHTYWGSGDMVLAGHVISQDHVTKE